MTTVAISGLPVATVINATDIIPFVQPATAGTTKSITKTLLFTSPTMVTPVLGAATATSLAVSGLATVGTTFGVTGATTLSSTLAVAGVSTLTGGAVVQGMTVGLGLAAVVSNTAVGFEVLKVNTTGNSNVGVGYQTLLANLIGEYNFAGGYQALKANNNGLENTAVGALALSANTGGDYNTAVGLSALGTQISGNNNVALGYYSGNYETGSNAFYVNNQDRTNTAGDKASSLMYGTFNATASSQTLKVNAALTVNGGLIGSVQTLSGAGAVNLTTSTTSFTSTLLGNALTLADGAQGQIKIIVYIAETAGGDTGILTPTNLGSATTITFNTIGDAVTLQFVGTDWWVVGFRGAVVA